MPVPVPVPVPDTPPQMRAAHLKENLASLSVLTSAQRDAILAGFSVEAREGIERATRVDWLPLAWDIELTELVHAHAGRTGLRDWAQVALRQTLDAPLLSGFFKGAMRLVSSPSSLIKLAPRAIGQIYRHLGRFEALVPDKTRADLVLHDPATQTVVSESWQLGFGDAILVPLQVFDAAYGFELRVRSDAITWSFADE